MDAFISHSSEDKPLARRLEQSLEEAGIKVWIDHANIRAGGLLLDALQDALSRSINLVLLWSSPASTSRYVVAEWQAAFHLHKSIIPCLLDDTILAPFLLRYRYCDFRISYAEGLSELIIALNGHQPAAPSIPSPGWSREPDRSREQTVRALASGQNLTLALLQSNQLELAAQSQATFDPLVDLAVRENPEDPDILSLAGYQRKNSYMIRYWDDIQMRKSPEDPVLQEAESLFFAALSVRPDDPSALNGLGSILSLRGDLDAAEFFVRRALALYKEEGHDAPYEAAEHDLDLIRHLKRDRTRPNAP